MDLLQPRQTYQRVNSDDPHRHEDHELRPLQGGITSKDKSSVTSRSELEPRIAYSTPSFKARWFSGWRTGASSAAVLAFCSLIINAAAAIWLSRHPAADSGLVEVFRGSCDTVGQMDIWIHLLINIISTLLLAGSNYCMQCLCAPTRSDVDKAHANGRYLDIGVPSFRNLAYVARHKTVMWWLLAMSSIPLHLMYNSAFYSSLATSDYDQIAVTPDFLLGGPIAYNSSCYGIGNITDNDFDIPARQIQQQLMSNDTIQYKRFDALSCIKTYAQVFVQDYRTLVVVSSNKSSECGEDSSVLWRQQYSFLSAVSVPEQRYQPYDWICEGDWDLWLEINKDGIIRHGEAVQINSVVACDSYLDRIEANAATWKPLGYDLDYCLAEVVDQHCSFNGNIPIVLTVIVCNLIKMVLMLIVAIRLRGPPLITIGDAVESFLNVPDPHTEGLCLYTLRDAKRSGEKGVTLRQRKEKVWYYRDGTTSKLADAPTTLRWRKAASMIRWTFTLALLLLALATVAGLLVPAIILGKKRDASILRLGFGKVQASTIISGWSIERIENPSLQVVAAILIANIPQVALSFLYFSINGLLTSMWTALEWSKFAKERNSLRVSTPKAQQRSKHFLQLPYHIAIPLMVVSGLLHWLLSQSIYLAAVAYYDALGNLVNPLQIASCGFSPLAMIMVLVLGTLIGIGIIWIGTQKYDSSMPFAGSSSVVISAACHRPDWDIDASLKKLKWGALPKVEGQSEIGHCCFTSGEVEDVQVGERYAGYAERLTAKH